MKTKHESTFGSSQSFFSAVIQKQNGKKNPIAHLVILTTYLTKLAYKIIPPLQHSSFIQFYHKAIIFHQKTWKIAPKSYELLLCYIYGDLLQPQSLYRIEQQVLSSEKLFIRQTFHLKII